MNQIFYMVEVSEKGEEYGTYFFSGKEYTFLTAPEYKWGRQ